MYKRTFSRVDRESFEEFCALFNRKRHDSRLRACAQYCKYLKNKHQSVYTLKNKYTRARNYVNRQFKYTKNERYIPEYLKVFELSESQNKYIKDDYKKKVHQKNTYLVVVKKRDIMENIKIASNYLSQKDKYTVPEYAICLSFLTGRRLYEVCCVGSFTRKQGELFFSGQAKTRNTKFLKYVIPSFIRSLPIIRYWNKFHDEFPHMKNCSNEEFHNRYSRTIGQKLKHFNFYGVSQPKDLRNLYAAYCIKKFKPVDISDVAYVSKILGHGEDDLNTANSYMSHIVV